MMFNYYEYLNHLQSLISIWPSAEDFGNLEMKMINFNDFCEKHKTPCDFLGKKATKKYQELYELMCDEICTQLCSSIANFMMIGIKGDLQHNFKNPCLDKPQMTFNHTLDWALEAVNKFKYGYHFPINETSFNFRRKLEEESNNE